MRKLFLALTFAGFMVSSATATTTVVTPVDENTTTIVLDDASAGDAAASASFTQELKKRFIEASPSSIPSSIFTSII